MRKVTIEASDDYLGMVQRYATKLEKRIEYDESPNVIARIENLILVCYAGGFAQRKYAPRSRWRIGAAADHEMATKLFFHICGEDEKVQYHYSSLLWRRAELRVDWLWPEITELASALLQEKTMEWGRVRQILSDAWAQKHGVDPAQLVVELRR